MRTRKMESVLRKWGRIRDLDLEVEERSGGLFQAVFRRISFPGEISAGVWGSNRRIAVDNLARSVFRWENVESLEELELQMDAFGGPKTAITSKMR